MEAFCHTPETEIHHRAILLPGNDLPKEFYRSLGGELALRGVCTTVFDIPGLSGPRTTFSVSWQAYVDLISDALATLGDGGAVIGHSLGGLLAFLVAARVPHQVTRLILLEPAILPNRLFATLAARRYIRDVVQGDRTRFSNWSGSYDRVANLDVYPQDAIDLYVRTRQSNDPAVAQTLFQSIASLYPLPFRLITIPTLVLHGQRTGVGSALLMRFLASRFARGCVASIPGAAHWIANERDREAAGLIADFLG